MGGDANQMLHRRMWGGDVRPFAPTKAALNGGGLFGTDIANRDEVGFAGENIAALLREGRLRVVYAARWFGRSSVGRVQAFQRPVARRVGQG